ncbi:hypothetical protein KO481_15795 [Nocardia sp. NEAU-G5]|uniref:WXG100 family type VII secretion target n=1 Tax=Nocardia albiluteola TaxID=2842303 RepID=A0ABS6B0K0_9NOCA|nr:hypothetical protein [Nocardia albiluteola]MBU3062981.1 hypothetical protein [Nocardia albiluteola]
MTSPMTRYDSGGMDDYHATMTKWIGELQSCLSGVHGAHRELQNVWTGAAREACDNAVQHLTNICNNHIATAGHGVNAARKSHDDFVSYDGSFASKIGC